MKKKKFDVKGKLRRKITREDDATWRLTHLLTAAHLMSHDVPSLSRFFMRTSTQIGRRINMTMDNITVKRHVCRKCQTLLIPNGPTPCRVRIAPRRETHVVVTCGHCGHLRRYPARQFVQSAEEEEAEKARERQMEERSKRLQQPQSRKQARKQKQLEKQLQQQQRREQQDQNQQQYQTSKGDRVPKQSPTKMEQVTECAGSSKQENEAPLPTNAPTEQNDQLEQDHEQNRPSKRSKSCRIQ